VFAKASGMGSMGLGLKDADDILAEGNLFVGNEAAIHLDNSPLQRGSVNTFSRNLVLNNAVGVRLLPAVKNNLFIDNDFVDNRRPVEITGGSGGRGADQNEWTSNYWSSYAGFDSDGDGLGDTPFVYARIADEWVARHPSLQIFAFSPAVQALDILGRFFPLLQPQPVAIDETPRVQPARLARWQTSPPVITDAPRRSRLPRTAAAAAWAGLGLMAIGGLGSAFRTRSTRRFSRRFSRRRAATRTTETP
jgi:nitrous oxidase accessory protein